MGTQLSTVALGVVLYVISRDDCAVGFRFLHVATYSPIVHNQWTQLGTGRTPVRASHSRAILIQCLSKPGSIQIVTRLSDAKM